MFFDAKYDRSYVNDTLLKNIINFWNFFKEREEDLIEALYSNDRDFMKIFDDMLNSVFSLKKKDIRYSFSFKNGIKNFTIYYGYSSYMLTVANELFDYSNKKLIYDWNFKLEKNKSYLLFQGKKPRY